MAPRRSTARTRSNCAVDQAVTGERLGFRLPYCIDSGSSGTFGNVTPIAADEPLGPMALTYINHVNLLTGDGEVPDPPETISTSHAARFRSQLGIRTPPETPGAPWSAHLRSGGYTA
jgi:hypothetical protein